MQPLPQPDREHWRRQQEASGTEEAKPAASLDFGWFAIGVVLCLVGAPFCVAAARTLAPSYHDAGERAPESAGLAQARAEVRLQVRARDKAQNDAENPLGVEAS